ncbi:MAG: BadF/BadG/BcrA/BcrD ATPase family protein [Anaerolineae bacterium]|jgi:N-acetylglucosamine kinase-like BadF-type ATPase
MLFLGIDAGGTKTHALLADETGRLHGAGQAGPGNWETVGLDGAFDALHAATTAALAQAGAEPRDVTATGCGLAGLDWPSDEARLRPVVERLGIGGPQILVNDSFAALRAGAADPWGVVVVAGTGAIAAGRNQAGQVARTFGLSYPFDDWGSAPELAEAVIYSVARASSGRGPATALTGHLVDLTGARGAVDCLERISRGGYDLADATPALVEALFQAAHAGDEVAAGIVEQAARALGGGAVLVIRRLQIADRAFDVVLSGGLFRSRDPLLIAELSATVRSVAPQARIGLLELPPVVGGVLLAMDAGGVAVSPSIRCRLAEGGERALGDRVS